MIQLISVKDYEQMSEKASSIIIETMKENIGGLFCFAGGDTPVRTLEMLAEAHRAGQIDLHNYYYIELDEWVGLDQTNEGSCLSYLRRNLFEPAGVPEVNIHYFDSQADDLDKECKMANEYIERFGGITLSLLGVGVNGHIGFNEPGVDFTQKAHIVDLKPETITVGAKYFDEDVEISQGITLGMQQLLASDTVVLVANGASKKEAIQRLLDSEEPDRNWPVTAIKFHSNSFAVIEEQLLDGAV